MLSKGHHLAGLQCARRLWLAVHAPEDHAPETNAGNEIGAGARTLFPGGVLVGDAAWAVATARTRALLADAAVPALFDAAVEHAGVRVRVDVLERLPDGTFGLREVNASTRVKPDHLRDVAVQWLVLAASGIRIGSVQVLHVDPGYVRDETGLRWDGLLQRSEVGEWTKALVPGVAATLAAQRRLVARPDAPDVEPSPHCFRPYACEFWERCTTGRPADWIMRLPWLSPDRFAELRQAGVHRIVEIPDALVRSDMHRRARDAWRTGTLVAAPALGTVLARAGPPADYLDFETLGGPVPFYPGTHPYQQVPCQWSLHRLDADGRTTHAAFLARFPGDPRRAFAESLRDALAGSTAPILVYSDFENRVLADLAAALPDLAPDLRALRARLVDLLPIVREHVYTPAFGGGFSLKGVAPALAPELRYDDLPGVSDGAAASAALSRLARGAVAGPEAERQRAALLAYCERDTLALMAVHRRLREIAAAGPVAGVIAS